MCVWKSGPVIAAEGGVARLVTIPFAPAGACAERAATFIALVKARGYQEYSFWHWGGAPSALREVLNTTAP